MTKERFAAILASLLLFSSIGCGSAGRQFDSGAVSGKLTLNGQPVPAGTSIQFMSESGDAMGGEVGADGSYSVKGVPVGTCKVMVTPPTPAESDPAAAMKMVAGESPGGKGNPKAFEAQVAFPTKYLTFATSGETVDVKSGDNEYSLDMKK